MGMRLAALVFMGAGAGGVARYLVGVACLQVFGPGFPVATLIVNVVGSLAMGVLAHLALESGGPGLSAEARALLMTGVLGGFTTFSTFSLDVVALWQRGEPWLATAYGTGSVVMSVAALLAGLWIGRALW